MQFLLLASTNLLVHFEREQPEVSDLETDPESVEPCQFEPKFILQCQITTLKMMTVETKKDSTVGTGKTLYG